METPPSSPPREEARPSPSRFANIQTNVRNLLRASSVYPDTAVGSPQTTPRVPRVPFLRRIDARISTQRPSVPQQELPSTFAPFASGAGQQTTANPSTPLIQQPAATYSPASLPSSWNDRYEASPAVSQGSWVAPSRQQSGDSESRAETDIEAQQPRRKRKRRRHHNAWIKRKHRQSVHTRHVPTAAQSEQKTRVIWCAASGIFLAAMLTICKFPYARDAVSNIGFLIPYYIHSSNSNRHWLDLSLALTVSALNQSVHVMFILVILGSTVLFCHSLIRLCIIKLRPQRSHRPRIPEYADINGFKPDVPIRVHLAQDEEIAVAETTNGQPTEEVEGLVKQPPPAYGLWRCSVVCAPLHMTFNKKLQPKYSRLTILL